VFFPWGQTNRSPQIVAEVQKAWTPLNTPIRFQGVMEGTTFMCAPTNIYLDYTRNTCVEEVATATRVQTRSYSRMHLDTFLSYVLFYLFTFQFPTSSFILRFPLSNTMHFVYFISFPNLYSKFLLFLRSFRFPTRTHITKIKSLQTSQLFFSLFRDSLNVNG
jgi:hypothetical protein